MFLSPRKGAFFVPALFQRKQEAFDAEPRGIASQAAVGMDDPMAGDDDGEGVFAVGIAHGPAGAWASDVRGQHGVAPGLAVGDVLQSLPDAPLEGRAPHIERKAERAQAAVEIGVELPVGLPQMLLDSRGDVRRG